MHTEYWHSRWHKNEIGFNQNQPNPFLTKYFPLLGLQNSAKVFVPLCGKSVDMLWLLKQKLQIIGVELSAKACEDFFKENQLDYSSKNVEQFHCYSGSNISLLSGDIFDLNSNLLGTVDGIYDRAALSALPFELRKRYVEKICLLAQPSAKLLLITLSYDQTLMQGPPFSVSKKEVFSLYGNHFEIKVLHDAPTENIPIHLQAKGLTNAYDHVFLLTRNEVM